MTEPYYDRYGVTVHHGDCLDVLAVLPDASVHAVVTDPPYGLEFMGKEWDNFRPSAARLRTRVDARTNPADGKSITTAPEAYVAGQPFQRWCEGWLRECLRVLKPGGHLLAFGGSRTWHRLAAAVEDAGFEVRDSMAWLYASGFPKSLDVSRAIDKAAGAQREVLGTRTYAGGHVQRSSPDRLAPPIGTFKKSQDDRLETAPATPAAEQWQGWGTALKPAFEPIVVARKPLAGTVAANVLEHGAGALNVDGCRVAAGQDYRDKCASVVGLDSNRTGDAYGEWTGVRTDSAHAFGRWPTNVVLTHATTPDGVDLCGDECVPGCVVGDLDEQSGITTSSDRPRQNTAAAHNATASMGKSAGDWTTRGHADTGGASRFFPVFRFEAKAPSSERPRVDGVAHPTVKPLALMRWLVRLVTPPGGVVLDPFLGSGTTAQAARAEGFRCIGIEREGTYLPLIRSRLDGEGVDLFGGDAA